MIRHGNLLLSGFSAALLLLATMVWRSARPVSPSSSHPSHSAPGLIVNSASLMLPADALRPAHASSSPRDQVSRSRSSVPVREISASTAFARSIRQEGSSPSDDLAVLQMLVTDYRRVHSVVPPAVNSQELARLLMGENPTRSRFLPPDCPALDDEGQLLDRWGTPLSVHLVSDRQIELRSAGPDRTLWNEDDILVN